MKFFILGFVLVCTLILAAHADPEPAPAPEPAKSQRSSHPKFRAAPSDDIVELRAADDNVNDENDEKDDTEADASSGRLFMKKFLLFKNIFGSTNQQQPVIPIIIAGGTNAGTGGAYTTPSTSPTVTYTSTGSIPTASGTISITTPPTAGFRSGSGYNDDDGEAVEDAAVMDEQAVQAALAGGAHEYVVTDDEIKGSSDSKVTKQPGRINLRRKGAKTGQVVSVRIPPKYRNYFKNGQKVMLNTGNRPVKRRVYKKRGGQNVRRRKAGNKNKRNRIGAH